MKINDEVLDKVTGGSISSVPDVKKARPVPTPKYLDPDELVKPEEEESLSGDGGNTQISPTYGPCQ